jgi:hypothetical protein
MYRVLWVVVVIAVIALSTSVIAAVVQHDSSARQSSEINMLDRRESADHKAISGLDGRLNKLESVRHHKHARKLSASTFRPRSRNALAAAGSLPSRPAARVQPAARIRPNPAVGPAALPYSGLTWRHALLLN